MGASKVLNLDIFGRERGAVKAIHGVAGASEKLGETLKHVAAGFGLAFSVDAVIEFGKKAVEAAATAQQAQASLKVAVKNSGNSWADYSDQIEEADKSGRSLGFTNADTTQALATLTTSLKDPKKALEVLGVAQDLARAKGMDLNAASLLVAKGIEGQVRPLKALGIDLNVTAGTAAAVATAQKRVAAAQDDVNAALAKYPDAAQAGAKGHDIYEAATKKLADAQQNLNDKQSTGGQILQTLKDRLGGSASANADTYAGKVEILTAKFDDLQEKVGNKLIPVLGNAADVIESRVLPALEDLGHAKGVDEFFAAIEKHAHNGDLFGFLDPSAWNHGLDQIASWMDDGRTDPRRPGGPLDPLVWAAGWDDIDVTFAKRLVSWGNNFSEGTAEIGNTIESEWEANVNGMAAALNFLFTPLNALIKGVNELTGSKIPPVKFTGYATTGNGKAAAVGAGGGVKRLASGGIVRATPGGTPAVIGEAGTDEAVIPLNSQNLSAMSGSGGGPTVVIQITGMYAGDKAALTKTLSQAFKDSVKNGSIPKDWAVSA